MTENQELLQQVRAEVKKPTAVRFFDQQARNEKRNAAKGFGAAPDYGMVFNRTLFDFLHLVRKETDLLPKGNLGSLPVGERKKRVIDSRRQLRQRTEAFMTDMRAIEMEDTIYSDVRTGLPELIKNVDGVLVWTSGHPNYQLAKIEKSKIQRLLEASASDSEREVVRDPLISRNKEKDTLGLLEQFASEHPEGGIAVVIYDDSQGNFVKGDRIIGEFEEGAGRKVNRLFVWAKVGRVGDSLTPDGEKEAVSKMPDNVRSNLHSVSSFTDFVKVMVQYRSQTGDSILVLLDFDGALSDNRIMRLRQSQVFHNHLRRIIRDIVLPEGTKKQIEEMENSLSDLLAKEK